VIRTFALIASVFLTASVHGEDGAALLRALGTDAAFLAPPKHAPAEGFEQEGVRAVYMDGPAYRGKPTKVFAWVGVPKVEAGRRAPAMVLVHGGGGTAFAEWVRLWTSRGYAAIAMDTCGQVPRGTYGKWERNPDGGPPGWSVNPALLDLPAADQWQYHAIASVVLSHSLIRSLPEVDPDRVGLTGISWGGYLTCIAVGVDARFKLAVPVYGCGFYEDCVWGPELAKMPADKRERWLAWWDPKAYLPAARMPILWVNGTNDFAYPMVATRRSYLLPKGERHLSVTLRMPHGHGGAGEKPPAIHAFADSILKDGAPLPRLTRQGREGRSAWAEFEAKAPLKQGTLLYTKASGPWQKREWQTVPASLEAGRVRAELPDGVTVYYLSVTDARGFEVSSEHEEMTNP